MLRAADIIDLLHSESTARKAIRNLLKKGQPALFKLEGKQDVARRALPNADIP